MGHRNPQGITQTSKGKIISSEFGFNNDELNLIISNKNYGWNVFDGDYCQSDPDTCDFYYPLFEQPIDIGENPPSGIDYYSHPAIPEFNGIIEAVPGQRGTQGIISYGLNSNHTEVTTKVRYLISKTNQFFSAFGRIRDVCSAPNGDVYFIGYDRSPKSAIYKITNPTYCTGQIGFVNNGNDNGPGSLRQAIDCIYDGGTITFSQNMESDTFFLTNSTIQINKKVNLISPFVSPIKIKSTSNATNPMFYIGQFGSLTLNKIHLYAQNHTGEGRVIINDGKLNLSDVQITEDTNGTGSSILNLNNATIQLNKYNSVIKN